MLNERGKTQMDGRTAHSERRASRVGGGGGGGGGGGCFCRNIVTNRINIGYFCCFCRNIGRNKPRRCRNKGVLCGLLRNFPPRNQMISGFARAARALVLSRPCQSAPNDCWTHIVPEGCPTRSPR